MIHVLIKRRIAEGMLSTYEKVSRHALHSSYVEPGFIAGEAFADVNDSNHRFVLCKWRSTQDWLRWQHSARREELMNAISPTLLEPENVVVLSNSSS